MRVYLSGGMQSNWQEKVIQEVPDIEFSNPATHGLEQPEQYTAWDLFKVAQSDIVFAYLEKDNPSGVGLALEIGYAKALGKLIIFVDEKEEPRFEIVKHTSTVVFNNLEDGIQFLRRFV